MVSVLYSEFYALMSARRYADAAAFAENESLKGSEPFWRIQRARALIRLSDFRRSLEISIEVLEFSPDDLYAVSTAADSLVGLKRYDEALHHYEELLAEPRLAKKGRKGVLGCLAAMKKWDHLLDRISSMDVEESDRLPWKIKALVGVGNIRAP